MENLVSKSQILRFSFEDDICIIEMNDENKPVNQFTMEFLQDLDLNLSKILKYNNLAGIILASSKPNCFAAGADISIFDTLTTLEAGIQASRSLQSLFDQFAQAHVPTLAAIHGVCLGGGLELSLACHYRLCSNHESTQLGLPEVQLGILPGGGGTQRLPRLIGIAQALDMILTGKKVDGKKALRLGLVDDCVPPNQLLQKAIEFCKSKKGTQSKRPSSTGFVSNFQGPFDAQKMALEKNPLGRFLITKQSRDTILKKTKGYYPAPLKALEAVMKGMETSLQKGLEHEAKLFGELVVSPESRSLVHVFHIMTAAKKNPYGKDVQTKSKSLYSNLLASGSAAVGVLGAGLMGSGISTVLSDKGIRSLLVDKESRGLQKGLKAVRDYFEDRFKKRKLRFFEKEIKNFHTCPSLSFASLKNCPIVIEAVFENTQIKQDVLKKCEDVIPNPQFIFATNTSSIPISQIAAQAKRPENVIGMHFFSPVPKMPLVEIVVTPKTSPVVASAVFELATRMGKQAMIVKDGPGFYTTRILAFQVAEALLLLQEGARMEDIDQAMENFGMPVGPITLLDEVGIDVGDHIIHVLKPPFQDRLVLPRELESLLKEDRRGRKNSKGFYSYENGKKTIPDQSIYKYFEKPRVRFDLQEMADRCVYVFMNEAARCVDEGVVKSDDDADFGAIFGLGFPPFLGGPLHYAKTLGKARVKEKLESLSAKHGKRFEPAKYWSL